MTDANPHEDLLRKCARVELDDNAAEAIRDACRGPIDWRETIRQAELHGMAPYMHMQLRRAGAEVPGEVRRQLAALSFRHTEANRIRTGAVLEICEELNRQNIDILVLKGAALAHLIYDRPGLRPMRDIDLLVSPEQLQRASDVLAGLGYRTVEEDVLPHDHHHLPTVARTMDGLRVSIELHHDALAPDNIGSIRLDRLTEPARAFQVDGAALHALGHIDMLRHLCRHALEPRETTKIGSALDIMLYAAGFADDIDWPRMRSQFPEVTTMLQLLGYLVHRPAQLASYLPEHPGAAPPEGVGVGLIPLSQLRRRADWAGKLFNPSDWWLRCFYNVPPGHSLAYTKALRHPARVASWLLRRLGRLAH